MKLYKQSMYAVLMAACICSFAACDDDEKESDAAFEEAALMSVNQNFVETTVVPTYEGLVEATGRLIGSLQAGDYMAAAADWKEARQYWEWSEAFLFGAAAGYGIDPHIDTWPFDAAAFNNYMSKFSPSTNPQDAANLLESIATGQGLTGFHAVEYILFRNGEVRTSISADEAWFCQAAAEDLYLSACKLVMAWGGELSKEQQDLLEEAEFECDQFGEEFVNAGQKGSRWNSVEGASIQIIEGCQDIIDEVAHSKIGAPYTGDDTNYIESPHAYNSIQDFYDNIQSCRHALYGLKPAVANNAAAPSAESLVAYGQKHHPAETSAVQKALEASLSAIDAMPKPFVLHYQDAKVGAAIQALEALDSALDELKEAMEN